MVHMQSLTFQDTDLTYIFERANKKTVGYRWLCCLTRKRFHGDRLVMHSISTSSVHLLSDVHKPSRRNPWWGHYFTCASHVVCACDAARIVHN
jgi:hypothetical protein